jgi:hypothetical protein
MIVFVSGHLDLTADEFAQHYEPRLRQHVLAGDSFVVGDARGADRMAHDFLKQLGAKVTVFHMKQKPRYETDCEKRGGYKTDNERDAAMTAASNADVAWVRPGRENSGTARNLARRQSSPPPSKIDRWGWNTI